MFWKLLEVVTNCMMVFQQLDFDPVKKNTENTMSHLYFNEKVIILSKIHVKIKPFAPP